MDLWIRSQDKTRLIKIDYLKVFDDKVLGGSCFLGEYCTEQRALEVLDDIQNLLFTRIMCKADTTDDEADLLFCKESQGKMIPDTMLFAKPINLNSIVYQMPEK